MTARCRWCGITRQQYHDLGGDSEHGPHEWVEDPADTSWVGTEDVKREHSVPKDWSGWRFAVAVGVVEFVILLAVLWLLR